MKELTEIYEPQKTEEKIYKPWEESGLFKPDNAKSGGKSKRNWRTCGNISPALKSNWQINLFRKKLRRK